MCSTPFVNHILKNFNIFFCAQKTSCKSVRIMSLTDGQLAYYVKLTFVKAVGGTLTDLKTKAELNQGSARRLRLFKLLQSTLPIYCEQ